MSLLLSNISNVCLSTGAVLAAFKIIGIVVLIIVVIIVALFICVLFAPARYRVRGNLEEKTLDIKVQWLLQIIKFRFFKDKDSLTYRLYFFGIPTKILDKENMERRKKRREKRKQKKSERKRKSRKKKYKKKHDKYKEQFLKENPKEEYNTSFNGEVRTNVVKTIDDMESKLSGFDSIKKVLHIIKVFLEYQPVRTIWPDAKKLLYRARPRSVKGEIIFGFDDPALTGQILGLISNLYFLYQYDKFYISGDFETEKSYFKGNVDAKGHIRGLFGVVFIIRLFRKKKFKKFMDALKL